MPVNSRIAYTESTPTPAVGSARELKALEEIRELRNAMEEAVSPLNTSHGLALGWLLDDDLRIVKNLLELKREQLLALELAHYNLKKKIQKLGYDPKDLG